MRFNKTEVQRLMPNDTIYITILRDPVSMFESLFSYYNQYCQSFKRVANGSLEAFLQNPRRYYRPDEKDSMYARNTLTFDLGGDKDRTKDVAYARAFVEEVEQVFSLVMIAEYFDESLVLLRHLLSWDLDDILYVKLNMRTESSKRSLTPGLPAKIRAWNSLDALLYDHFNASLWRQLSALGLACVAREVRLLQQAQERLMRSCFGGSTPLVKTATQIKNKELRPWQPSGKVSIVGYDLPVNVSRGFSKQAQELCLKLIMPEIPYTQTVLRSQSLRYRRSYQQAHAFQRSIRTVLTRRPQVPRDQSPPAASGPVSETGSTTPSKPAAGSQDQPSKLGPDSSQTQALK